jgi:hypothetical protein
LTLILRMGLGSWWCHSCPKMLPIHWLCVTATKSLIKYPTYNTTNRWPSVDAHFDVLSIQHLLPSIVVFITIWPYSLSFWWIETLPCGKAERSHILALCTLTWQQFMYVAKSCIAPATHLFINRYPQATAHHLPIIYLQLKLSDKIHTEAGATWTHSVLLFFHSLIPPRFRCIDRHQQIHGLSPRHSCRPNQSGNMWRGAYMLLPWALRNRNAIALLCMSFNVRHTIVIDVIWIISIPIPVKPIFSVRNAFKCAILIPFDWITVYSPDSADI